MPAWRPREAEGSSIGAAPEAGKDLRFVLAARNKLPRSLSLKRRLDIDALFKHGQRFSGHFCSVIWQSADKVIATESGVRQKVTRFQYGVFVSKKLGNAVARNRLKRLYREAIRLNRHELTVAGRLGVLPITRGKIPDWKEINNEVRSLIQKISN